MNSLPVNTFKQALARQQRTIGLWVTFAHQPIAEVLQFLREHPGCTRKQMVDQLRPDAGDDSAKVAEVISPLRWLIEKGHVIEFFDGTLAVPTAAAKSAPRSS